MIHRFSENITVLYDGDAAGINAALRGIDLLEDGMNVKVVLLPEGRTRLVRQEAERGALSPVYRGERIGFHTV